MKLYYAPGACSMAAHIVLREAGYDFDLERVDLATGKLADDSAYSAVNPKGYVPALALDDGQILTEVAAILQYLADARPELKLSILPPDLAHYRLAEWLNFISAEVHKSLGALFNPRLPAQCRGVPTALFRHRCDWLANALGAGPFLMGEQYTIADPYLFTILGWTRVLDIDLGQWPELVAYRARIASRPAVLETLRAEGLVD